MQPSIEDSAAIAQVPRGETIVRVGPSPAAVAPAILLAEQLVGVDRESVVRIVAEQDASGHIIVALELRGRAEGACEQRGPYRYAIRWPPPRVRIPLTTLALQELARALDRVAGAVGVRR